MTSWQFKRMVPESTTQVTTQTQTQGLDGEHLSEAYLEFLPECMKSVAAEIEDDMREKSRTFDKPDLVMERAKRHVARMADPSTEHARLACALGVSPPPFQTNPIDECFVFTQRGCRVMRSPFWTFSQKGVHIMGF